MSERVPCHKFDRFLRTAQLYEERWRKKNQQCFEYCDDEQWTPDEMAEIESRGQQPTVINTIQPTVDMICAVADERKSDIQVVGREESDDNMAQLLTELLKHTLDVSEYDYYFHAAEREAMIGGRAWFEVGIHTDERGKDLVKVDHLPWENVYCDPFSRKPDASDARFIIKVKWVDRDVAKALFGDAAEDIDSVFNEDYKGQEYEAQNNSAGRNSDFYYDPKSNRLRICECYYTVPENRKVKILNEETGSQEEKEIFVNAVHYVIFSDEIILQGSAKDDSKNVNPLGIDYIPIVPMYCRRDRKGLPKGIVASLIDLQDQINKLNSKFLWTLMTNRLIAESGALRDPDEAKEEMQRPDGLIILNEGGLSKIRVDEKYRDLSYMSAHLNFLFATEQRISGVNDSMLGLGGTNERSGIMQSTRITQGASMQTSILKNMMFSKKRLALIVLRLIGKFYTDYRVIRITQPNGNVDNYEFNAPVTETNKMTGQMTTRILNKIDDTLFYDVILKEVAPFTAIRERQLQIFSEVLKSGVIPAQIAGKIMLMLSDMPNKQDLIREMESVYQQQQEAAMAAAAQGQPIQ